MVQNRTKALEEIFTDSEMDIASLLKQEFVEKQIADRRFTSHNTVRTHTANMRKKIGVKSNIGIVVRYMEYLQNLNSKKHIIPAIAAALLGVFISNNIKPVNQSAMEIIHTSKSINAKDIAGTVQGKMFPAGSHTNLEMRADGYLLVFDAELSSKVTYQRSATYDQSEEGDKVSGIEVSNLQVTDMEFNEIDLSIYELALISESIKNNISVE